MASDTSILAGLSAELAEIIEKVGPSVVAVDDGSRLTATGTIYSSDGLILATSHGTERDEDLVIGLGDGARLPASMVGRDPDTDLAVLKVEATELPAIRPAGLESIKVGSLALALGRPAGEGLQATLGIVSAVHETEINGDVGVIVNTDAVLYPGFSGGPLVDVNGEAIGITNRMFGRGAGVAIGISVAGQVTDALLAHGNVPRGYLGVSSQPIRIPRPLQEKAGLSREPALLVVRVESGGPAEGAGVMVGDILLALNGDPIQQVDDLRRALRRTRKGEEVTLKLGRGGEVIELAVTLGGAC